MARRNSGLFDVLAAAPWPVGIIVGLIGFLIIRYGIAAWFAESGNPYIQGLATSLQGGGLTPLAWAVLGIGTIASLVSFVDSGRRRRLIESRVGLDSLREISWRDFERLTAELFRRRGYTVEETGGGGADGGADLLLRKDGALDIVQCKQWKQRQVAVSTAREVFGLLEHHHARKAWIICCGEFTRDARTFVEGKPIELLSGPELVDAIRAVQTRPLAPVPAASPQETAPACPICSATMVQRTNRRNGARFWGCAQFPKCRGTVAIPRGT